jgi:hypothetical protein
VLTYSVEQLPSFDADFYNAARAELSNDADNSEEVPSRHLECHGLPRQHHELGNEGPQVGDLNLWNAHDLTERFYRAAGPRAEFSFCTAIGTPASKLDAPEPLTRNIGAGCLELQQ